MVVPIIFIVWIAKVTQGSRKSLNNGRAVLGRELEDTSVDGVYDMVGSPIPDCICSRTFLSHLEILDRCCFGIRLFVSLQFMC